MRWNPEPYQEMAVRFGVERGQAGFFLDPGLGKTSILLAMLSLFQAQKLVRGALVLAPLRVAHSVWPGEVRKWDEFRGMSITVLHGPEKEKHLREKHDIYVINYEGLSWLFDELNRLPDWPFDMLIVDESSKVKNTRTLRAKLLRPMLGRFRRRYILTGSPAPNGLLDLFGQVYVMDRGATFGPYITHYREKYFFPTGFGGYEWHLKKGADELIHAALAPRVLRLSAADYLKLPKLIVRDLFVDLPSKARAAYTQMEDKLRADLEAGLVTAVNAGVASGKCRQIAGGAVYDGNGRTWLDVHDAKVSAVADLVEEMEGQPCMIVYEFEHELDRLRRLWPDAPALGKLASAKALIVEKAWNAGDIPIMFVQPQSVGHGLNLQEAGRGQIWITPTWDLEIYEQMIRRMWRKNRKTPVFVHRVIARDTIDEVVVATLKIKSSRQTALYDALKAYWKGKKI